MSKDKSELQCLRTVSTIKPSSALKEAVVDSCRHPKNAFSPQELANLDLALESALATARELGLPCAGLEGTLRRRLFHVASKGTRNIEALRDEALKEMNVDRIAN